MIVAAKDIEQVLQPLLGLPLSDMSRFSGWRRFKFGPQKPAVNRRGEDVTWADDALHVACGRRVIGPEGRRSRQKKAARLRKRDRQPKQRGPAAPAYAGIA